MVTCSEDSQYWHVMYAAKTIHTESSSTFSKAGLVTYDATCKSCHGENFIDEIIVTGVRFIDEVIVTGVRIDRDDGNILDTSRIPGLGGGFGGPGSIGGDYEDEEETAPFNKKAEQQKKRPHARSRSQSRMYVHLQ